MVGERKRQLVNYSKGKSFMIMMMKKMN